MGDFFKHKWMVWTGLTLRFDPSRCERRGVYGRGRGSNPHGSCILLRQREQQGAERQIFIYPSSVAE